MYEFSVKILERKKNANSQKNFEKNFFLQKNLKKKFLFLRENEIFKKFWN